MQVFVCECAWVGVSVAAQQIWLKRNLGPRGRKTNFVPQRDGRMSDTADISKIISLMTATGPNLTVP